MTRQENKDIHHNLLVHIAQRRNILESKLCKNKESMYGAALAALHELDLIEDELIKE